MSDIHDLEQRLQVLEDAFAEQSGKIDRLLEKSDKALDLALHAYKVDHYGFIWQYDCETRVYVKSNMRVCTPEIADRALQSRHIANNAVTTDKLEDKVITTEKLADKAVTTPKISNRAVTNEKLADESVSNEKLADESVSGRNIQRNAVSIDKLAPGTIDPTKIVLSDVAIDIDENNGDIIAYFYNDCGVNDVWEDEYSGDIIVEIDNTMA